MNASHRTQALLLLTAVLPGASKGGPKPLTATEWSRLAKWMNKRDIAPEALLDEHPADVLEAWDDSKITLERVAGLTERGAALALAMDEWDRAGIWVLTRSDSEYPWRFRKVLRTISPPVLFGCGPKRLLGLGGVAVVGSRNAGDDDLALTRALGAVVASSGQSIVSGGARGVDEAAMLGALEAEGTAVGVLANDLLRTASSKKYRRYVLAGDLALISAVHPKARFSVGNAMGRNKYIYALSDRAVVVTTSYKKGGTWSGAEENLKRGWVPLYVWRGKEPDKGKEALVGSGARWLNDPQEVVGYAEGPMLPVGASETLNLFSTPSPESPVGSAAEEAHASVDLNGEASIGSAEEPVAVQVKPLPTLYEMFLRHLKEVARSGPLTEDALLDTLGLERSQFRAWVKKAIEGGHVEKQTRPVRYSWNDDAKDSVPGH